MFSNFVLYPSQLLVKSICNELNKFDSLFMCNRDTTLIFKFIREGKMSDIFHLVFKISDS